MRQVDFNKKMSIILRGVAVILMVCNHSMPGEVISFEAQIFSFLIGYGYEFAPNKDWNYGAKRSWHTLSYYWIVLIFLIFPVVLSYTHCPFSIKEITCSVFGLFYGLHLFSWYVYFYIFCMTVMPILSQIIDKYSIRGTLIMCALSGFAVWALSHYPDYEHRLLIKAAYRCFKFLPIVLVGYWASHYKVFSNIKYIPSKYTGMFCILVCSGIYFIRSIESVQIIDFIWVPLFSICLTIFFSTLSFSFMQNTLHFLGLKSMKIWLIQGIFFTYVTMGIYSPLISWVENKIFYIIWVMTLCIIIGYLLDILMKYLGRLSYMFLKLIKT